MDCTISCCASLPSLEFRVLNSESCILVDCRRFSSVLLCSSVPWRSLSLPWIMLHSHGFSCVLLRSLAFVDCRGSLACILMRQRTRVFSCRGLHDFVECLAFSEIVVFSCVLLYHCVLLHSCGTYALVMVQQASSHIASFRFDLGRNTAPNTCKTCKTCKNQTWLEYLHILHQMRFEHSDE